MSLTDYQKANLIFGLLSKDQIIDPETASPIDWDEVGSNIEGVSDVPGLSAALAVLTAAVAEAMTNPMVGGGDLITALGATNYATSANGASASGDGGDNAASGMIDADDTTFYSTYNGSPGGGFTLPEGDRILINLGSVRSIGSVRFRQGVGGANAYASDVKFEYSTDTGGSPTTWVTIDAHRTLVSGNNAWTLTDPISARHWRITSLVTNLHGVAWTVNTWELLAAGAETPLRLAAGAAGTIPMSAGAGGQALAYSHPKVPTKAGVPTDSDVLTTAADGMMILDTTNHRLYIRDGGSWKYAALT